MCCLKTLSGLGTSPSHPPLLSSLSPLSLSLSVCLLYPCKTNSPPPLSLSPSPLSPRSQSPADRVRYRPLGPTRGAENVAVLPGISHADRHVLPWEAVADGWPQMTFLSQEALSQSIFIIARPTVFGFMIWCEIRNTTCCSKSVCTTGEESSNWLSTGAGSRLFNHNKWLKLVTAWKLVILHANWQPFVGRGLVQWCLTAIEAGTSCWLVMRKHDKMSSIGVTVFPIRPCGLNGMAPRKRTQLPPPTPFPQTRALYPPTPTRHIPPVVGGGEVMLNVLRCQLTY